VIIWLYNKVFLQKNFIARRLYDEQVAKYNLLTTDAAVASHALQKHRDEQQQLQAELKTKISETNIAHLKIADL
ncbi:MAG: hypothetical protein J7527_17500, partial [Chitinophagaceae bacterium]|nr:hypothetical protein [Chitinophagaceae bacterium]